MRNKSRRDREMDNRAYNGDDGTWRIIRIVFYVILSLVGIGIILISMVSFYFTQNAEMVNKNIDTIESNRPAKGDKQGNPEEQLTVTGGYTYKNHDFEAGRCIDNLYDENGKMQFTVKSLEDTWYPFKTLGNVYAMINVDGGMKMAVLRNNKGESFVASETGSIAVYPHGRGLDNTLVYFSDDDSFVTEDITQIDLLAKGVYELKNSGLGRLNGIDWSAEEATTGGETASPEEAISYMFTIDYCGYEEIHKLYSSVSKEYADKMVNGMKESLKDAKETVNLRLMYICGDTGMAGGACGVYISNEPLTASDKDTQKLQLLWDFNEIRLVYDWELPDKLYKHNFKDETPKNVEKLSSIVYDTTLDLTKMLQTWEKDRETDAAKAANMEP